MQDEDLEIEHFKSIGRVKNQPNFDQFKLENFIERINALKTNKSWKRADLVSLFTEMIPDFNHKETGKFLDERM